MSEISKLKKICQESLTTIGQLLLMIDEANEDAWDNGNVYAGMDEGRVRAREYIHERKKELNELTEKFTKYTKKGGEQ